MPEVTGDGYLGFGNRKRFLLAKLERCAIIAGFISRRIEARVLDRLGHLSAVALLGPRQVGTTTLAQAIAEGRKSIYLDLESQPDREKLADATFYIAGHEDDRVVLDEVQRAPELFATLRGLIDRGRRRGKKSGRFLLLGSATVELLRQARALGDRY